VGAYRRLAMEILEARHKERAGAHEARRQALRNFIDEVDGLLPDLHTEKMLGMQACSPSRTT